MKNNNLLIIDAYGFVFRAFFIQPRLTGPSGMPVSAIYGFTTMLIKLLNDFETRNIVVVFDGGGKNFRHELYPEYKANRPPIAEDLRVQLPFVRKAAESLNLAILEMRGVEADDIIATIATKANNENKLATIISPDKDLTQLITDKINVYDPVNNKFVGTEQVLEKFGVLPSQVRDYLAIVGDKSDNVPGIAGIGPKGAIELLTEFGSLKNIIEKADLIDNPKKRQKILDSKEIAMLSYELVGLKQMDIDVSFEHFAWTSPSKDVITAFINEFGFKSLNARIEKLCGYDLNQENEVTSSETKNINIKELTTQSEFDQIAESIMLSGWLSLNIENNKLYFTTNNKHLYCLDLENTATFSLVKYFISYIENDAIKKITFDLKKLLHILKDHNIFIESIVGWHDIMLMFYVASKAKITKITLDTIVYSFVGEQIQNQFLIFYLQRCYKDLEQDLFKQKTLEVYNDIDLKLCYILFKMEVAGIKIDAQILGSLSSEYNLEIKNLEKEIFEVCNKQFNIASPKQLGEVLYEWLKLPGGKISAKSKTYSTNIDALEKLSDLGFQGADLLLKWRRLNKIINTYVMPLLEKSLNGTDRIYTTFLQTSTLTARLSSVEPNLQNIPIKTPEGSKIRTAFIVEPGNKLISADYSQIELRILSNIANITNLQKAFKDGLDIHSITAAEMFNVPLEKVTSDLRRNAKAINFGIIYGISPFGLARQLKIPQIAAKNYIDIYFKRYPQILEYMEQTKEFAALNGYVETITKRRCNIENITAPNAVLKALAQRSAINAPIQGSAADIMRIAMINMDLALKKHNFNSKMILQIHDELLFEVPENEVTSLIPVIKTTLENIINMQVPLTVNISVSENWYKA